MSSPRLPIIDHRLVSAKGGLTRAANMTPEQRSEAMRHAANVRWKRYRAAKRALRKAQAA